MPGQKRHNMGGGGFCICPKCDFKMPHKNGVPCQDERCPNCNAKLLREGSDHHKMFLGKQNS
jgi:hypothetical protein